MTRDDMLASALSHADAARNPAVRVMDEVGQGNTIDERRARAGS